jgi:hypothetical protein
VTSSEIESEIRYYGSKRSSFNVKFISTRKSHLLITETGLNLYKHELKREGIVESNIKIHKIFSRILIYKDYLLRKLLPPCDFPSGLHPCIMAGEFVHKNILKNFNRLRLKLVYEGEE